MVTTTCFLVKVAGETPLERLRGIPEVVEVIPVKEPAAEAQKLPLEVRLKRQRDIIRARRGELKRFLSPR